MTRSRLKSKYNKTPTPENRFKYTKLRNCCVSFRNKAIRYVFQKETTKGNSTNKAFCKPITPYLTNKDSLVSNDIILVEEDKIISEAYEVAETFNDYFVIIVKTTTAVNPKNIKENLPSNTSTRDVVNAIIKEHPSIQKRYECLRQTEPFSFNFVSQDEVNKYLKKVNVNESTGDDRISPKILQITANVLDKPLTTVINLSISEMTFPGQPK